MLEKRTEDSRFSSEVLLQFSWCDMNSIAGGRDKWRLGEMESVLSDDAKSSGEAVQGEKMSL